MLHKYDQSEEIEERRGVASEWEHLKERIPVVRAALNEYDWVTERDASLPNTNGAIRNDKQFSVRGAEGRSATTSDGHDGYR